MQQSLLHSLTPSQIQAIQEQSARILAQRNLGDFCLWMNPRLKFQAYHDYVIEKIESTVNGTGKRNLIIAMPPRHTKPLDVDTLVLMSDGTYRRLGDIQPGEYIINRLGRAGRVEEVHEQGVRPVLKITTHSGRTVRAEASHPFWTPNGWVMAGYLEPGDVLACVNRPLPMEVRNDRRPEEFRLAGYLTGDGSISGNNAAFTNIDPEVLADITHCVETLGFKIRRQHPDRPTYQLTSGIRDWLRDNGMADTDSRTKRVPSWVFNATPDLIAEFVAAYFACDGCVTGRGFAQGRRDVLVEFSCIQRPLLEDTQRLLLRLGIQSRIRARQSTYTYKGNSKPVTSYSLALPSTDDVDKFATRVPVVGAKRERLIVAEHRRTSFDGDWLPDAVVSVEHDGEAECRCLSISGDPSFTANDLVVHNTEIVSNNLPAWILGRNPNAKIILASYNLELAMRNSRIARNKLDDPRWPFPEVALAQDSKAAQRWGTSDGGEVLAAGVGAGITGFGADVLIIDDYLRGREDADRKTERDRVWAWFREDASTRGQPGFKTICMATRWHSDDLIGRILNEPGALDEWEVVSLPALAEPGDPLGRVEGEPLDPERYPVHELLRIKARIGPRGWGALYQQRPTPAEGNLIKREWWQFYDPSEMKRKGLKATAMTVDPAFGAGDNNDPSVVGVWGMLNGRYYLMDVWRKSVSYPQLRLALGELYRKWHVTAVIEDIGPGKILLQEMRGASLARDDSTAVPTVAYKLPTVSTRTGGRMQSKLERAEAITNLIEGGLVFLPEKADWLEGYIEELSGFPTAPHDDQVDMTVMALSRLSAVNPALAAAFGAPTRFSPSFMRSSA